MELQMLLILGKDLESKWTQNKEVKFALTSAI